MSCHLNDDLPWSALLEARELLAAGAPALTFARRDSWVCLTHNRETVKSAHDVVVIEVEPGAITEADADGAAAVYRTNAEGLPDLQMMSGRTLGPEVATAARVYLPVLIGAARARRAGTSFVAGHLTQTLDGRIACENGQSQWIGNTADLNHSHRMRALLDGVMVGAKTAIQDNPQLTVRRVEGFNPRRIVISGRGRVLTSGSELSVMRDAGCEVLMSADQPVPPVNDNVNVHPIITRDGTLRPDDMLAALRARGIYSIYLEGGSAALSSFLQARAIDLLQVHIASMILGSGLPSLQLSPVEHVEDGLQVNMDHAILDGHVLLTCRPRS